MAMICKVFGHKWNGCTCKRCSKRRDEQHDWNGCKCILCGKTRDEQHDWNECACTRCGKEKEQAQHDWNGCTCARCGKRRYTGHKYRRLNNIPVINGYISASKSQPLIVVCTICGREYRLTSPAICPKCYHPCTVDYEGFGQDTSYKKHIKCTNCDYSTSYSVNDSY